MTALLALGGLLATLLLGYLLFALLFPEKLS
jgi:K+-transporting ATPase KdpF subunit